MYWKTCTYQFRTLRSQHCVKCLPWFQQHINNMFQRHFDRWNITCRVTWIWKCYLHEDLLVQLEIITTYKFVYLDQYILFGQLHQSVRTADVHSQNLWVTFSLETVHTNTEKENSWECSHWQTSLRGLHVLILFKTCSVDLYDLNLSYMWPVLTWIL